MRPLPSQRTASQLFDQYQIILPGDRGTGRRSGARGVGKTAKNGDLSPINRYYSDTIENWYMFIVED